MIEGNVCHSDVNSASVRSLLSQNHAPFLAYLKRRLPTAQDAEDILHSALTKVMEQDPDVEVRQLSAWFYEVLRNAVADFHRRRTAETCAVTHWEEFHRHRRAEAGQVGVVCGCMGDLIPLLKPEYSQLLQRVELADEALASVAESLEITPNNASVRLYRARSALRKRLEATCGDCAKNGCFDCTCREV